MEQGTYIKITKELVDGEVVLVTQTGVIDSVPAPAKTAEERIAELEAKLEQLLGNG